MKKNCKYCKLVQNIFGERDSLCYKHAEELAKEMGLFNGVEEHEVEKYEE